MKSYFVPGRGFGVGTGESVELAAREARPLAERLLQRTTYLFRYWL